MEVASFIFSIISTVVSIAGLIISIISFIKIDSVQKVLEHRIQVKTIVSSIETIMKYPRTGLGDEEKRFIKTTSKIIEKYSNASLITDLIEEINKELSNNTPSVANITNYFSNIKTHLKEVK